MTAVSFNALDWLAKFEAAGFSEAQAKVQIEVIEKTVEIAVETTENKIALNRLLDDEKRKELATKGDIRDVEVKIEQIKADLTKTMVTVVLGGAIATMVGISAIILTFFSYLPRQ